MVVRRVTLMMLAAALCFGPLTLAAGAQLDEPEPPGPATIDQLLALYAAELFKVDFDGDGVPDITDSNGDGVPEVPGGEPGERDLTPADPSFLEPMAQALGAQGLETEMSADSSSKLLGDCSGMAMSFDGDGVMHDWAIGVPSNEGGGPTGQLIDVHGEGEVGTRAFTKSNPFKVHDLVVYFGRLPASGEGPIEHNWSIETAGISIDQGGDPNPNGKNRNAGTVNLVEDLPPVLRPAGIFPMSGELTSQNGLSCTAEGWIQFEGGNPLLTAPSAVAAAFGGIGLLGLLFNARPATTWKQP